MFITIGIEITFFGFGLCLLQALERLLESRDPVSPRVLFYVFNSIVMLGIALVAREVPQQYPASIFLFFTSLFIIGPVNLFYYHTLLYPERPNPYRIWIHCMPSVIFFFLELLAQLQPAPLKRAMAVSFIGDPVHHPLIYPLLLASVHILAYMIYILKTFLLDLGFRSTQKEFRFIGSIAVLVFLTVGMLFTGFLLSIPDLFISGSILNVFIHVCLYLSTKLFPQFFESLKKEIRKKRYEKSMLKGVNTDIIRDRLDDLMGHEALYRDNEITLSIMAEKLSLSPHQLSQFLNERMGAGFHDFVNRYRIREAQQILSEESEANIMSVCFRVGFNSKSSFNAAFKKVTGLTPREFKQGSRKDG